MAHPPTPSDLQEWGMLSMASGFFDLLESLPGENGPFLRPISTGFQPSFPRDLMMTRRYKGKTNEMLTHFLCNIARYSSGFLRKPWRELRVFDPLSGGGTTLFAGMMLGSDVAGVEKRNQDVQTTVAFLRQYLSGQRIKHSVKEERLKSYGARWRFTIGKEKDHLCVLASGETHQSAKLIEGFKKPHLIVTDLPYGIQHYRDLVPLLKAGLPVWASMMVPDGVLAMAWESSRFPRKEMIALVESETDLNVLNHPPYDSFAHRVDRVIKERDILVATV